MSKFVIDAYAWIAYLDGSNQKIKELMDQDRELYTNIVTVAEVISKTKRKNFDIDVAFEAIHSLSIIFNVNANLCKEVGLLHAQVRKEIKDFGLADAFVLLTAKKLNAKILTGDPHFKGFSEAILI